MILKTMIFTYYLAFHSITKYNKFFKNSFNKKNKSCENLKKSDFVAQKTERRILDLQHYCLLSLSFSFSLSLAQFVYLSQAKLNIETNFRVLVFVSDVWDQRVNVGEHPILHNP